MPSAARIAVSRAAKSGERSLSKDARALAAA
jgi:hypothetical protein